MIIYFLNNLPKKDVKVVEDNLLIEENYRKANVIDFSKFKVDTLKEIEDPVAWQQQIREEWNCH